MECDSQDVNMSGDFGIKEKRRRSCPNNRWRKMHTNIFLNLLMRLGKDRLERPTAQVFYKKLIEDNASLQEYSWTSMRDKLKNLKLKYKTALDWRATASAGVAGEEDTETIQQRIYQICPEFDVLDCIFCESGSMVPLFPITDTEDTSLHSLGDGGFGPLDYDPIVDVEVDEDVKPETAPHRPGAGSTKQPQGHSTSSRRISDDLNASSTTTTRTKWPFEVPTASSRRMRDDFPHQLLDKLHSDRVDYLNRKLAVDARNEGKKLVLMEKGLELEKLKLDIEREKNNAEMALKEKELEITSARERERLNQDFELRKLELELKYSTNLNRTVRASTSNANLD